MAIDKQCPACGSRACTFLGYAHSVWGNPRPIAANSGFRGHYWVAQFRCDSCGTGWQ